MAKKVILFLSELRPNQKQTVYVCPDGLEVAGVQTNEAPVLYLLRKHPDIEEILCIVTPEARATAWEHFSETVTSASPSTILTAVEYRGEQDFSRGPLVQIMSSLEAKDEILLETTGGPRNTVMDLLLLSRVLSYKDIPTLGAVYSSLQAKRIEDVSNLIHLFDLVGGMQELTGFGSVRTLRTYYGQQPEPRIDALLTAMEQLTETIILCRTRLIDDRMERFDTALREAEDCDDAMMRQLLPVFRAKFGKKLNTTALIKWCVRSDMLQQALTVYTERIPGFIIERSGLLQVDKDRTRWPAAQEYEDPSAVLFTRDLLMLSARSTDATLVDLPHQLKNYMKGHGNDIVHYAQTGQWTPEPAPQEIWIGIEHLAVLIQAVYKAGVFRHDWPAALPQGKKRLKILAERLNVTPPETPYKLINCISNYPADYLWVLLDKEVSDEEPINYYIQTIEHLEGLLPGSGYKNKCSIEQLRAVLQDYLYIKALRNMTNHANHQGTSDQNDLMEHLVPYGYKPLEEVTLQDLKDILNTALRHLQPTGKKEWKR